MGAGGVQLAPWEETDRQPNAGLAPWEETAKPAPGPAGSVQPARPRQPDTVQAAPPPSLFERARESVANSAIGSAIQSTMPKVAQALHLEPTESEASPTYQQNRQAMPQLPAWTQKPLLPYAQRAVAAINRAADPLSYTAAGRAERAREEAQTAQQLAAYDVEHPYQAAAAQGVQAFGESMTTPASLAQLAVIPAAKPLLALYALQGAKGTYGTAEQAWEAHKAGNNPEAAKLATEAGLSGVVTALAGKGALDNAFPVDTARPTVSEPLAEGGFGQRQLPAPPSTELATREVRPAQEPTTELPALPSGTAPWEEARALPATTAGPAPNLNA